MMSTEARTGQSLHCTPEANTTLYANYTGIQKAFFKENLLNKVGLPYTMKHYTDVEMSSVDTCVLLQKIPGCILGEKEGIKHMHKATMCFNKQKKK